MDLFLKKGYNPNLNNLFSIDYRVYFFFSCFRAVLDLVDSEDSFLGLVDDNNNVIQFANKEDKWLLDIPNPPNFTNKQAYLKDTKCLNLIVEILEKKKIEVNTKLYDVNIMEETLSEVLNCIQ